MQRNKANPNVGNVPMGAPIGAHLLTLSLCMWAFGTRRVRRLLKSQETAVFQNMGQELKRPIG